MKVRAGTAAALVAGAKAQNSLSGYGDVPVSYMTITYDYCPTAALGTMIMITNGVTMYSCPQCQNSGGSPWTAAPPKISPGYATTYTTTSLSFGPTDLVAATYTVTQNPALIPGSNGGSSNSSPSPTQAGCDGEHCVGSDNQSPKPLSNNGGSVYMPPNSPPYAGGSGGPPAPGISSPAATKPPTSPAAGTTSNPPSPGSSPARTAPAPPDLSTANVLCPGSECPTKATSGAPGRATNVTTSSITPQEGGASSNWASSTGQFRMFASVALSVVVGGFTFAL